MKQGFGIMSSTSETKHDQGQINNAGTTRVNNRGQGIRGDRPRHTTEQASVVNEHGGISGTNNNGSAQEGRRDMEHDSRFTGRGWRHMRRDFEEVLWDSPIQARDGNALLLDAAGYIWLENDEGAVEGLSIPATYWLSSSESELVDTSYEEEDEPYLMAIAVASVCVGKRDFKAGWELTRLMGNWWRKCNCWRKSKGAQFHLNYLKKKEQQKKARELRKTRAQTGETGTESQVAAHKATGETGTVHVLAGRVIVQPREPRKRGGMLDMPADMVPARVLSGWRKGFGQDLGPNVCNGRVKGRHSIFNRIFKGEKKQQQPEQMYFEEEMQCMQHRDKSYPINVRLCMTADIVVLEHGGRLYP